MLHIVHTLYVTICYSMKDEMYSTQLSIVSLCFLSFGLSLQHISDHLLEDLPSPSISLSTCTALQGELARQAEQQSPEPHAKRPKLDPSLGFSSLSVHSRVTVCNAVRSVVDGHPVLLPFWKLFLSPEVDPTLYEFLFHVRSTIIQIK